MDLSKIEGLTPEQIEAINKAHDADIEGLKNNRDSLLEEKKTEAQKAAEAAEQAKAARDALTAKEQELLNLLATLKAIRSQSKSKARNKLQSLKKLKRKLITYLFSATRQMQCLSLCR